MLAEDIHIVNEAVPRFRVALEFCLRQFGKLLVGHGPTLGNIQQLQNEAGILTPQFLACQGG